MHFQCTEINVIQQSHNVLIDCSMSTATIANRQQLAITSLKKKYGQRHDHTSSDLFCQVPYSSEFHKGQAHDSRIMCLESFSALGNYDWLHWNLSHVPSSLPCTLKQACGLCKTKVLRAYLGSKTGDGDRLFFVFVLIDKSNFWSMSVL